MTPYKRPPRKCHVSGFRPAPARRLCRFGSDRGKPPGGWQSDWRAEGTALTSCTKERKDRSVGRHDAGIEVARVRSRGVFWQGPWRAIAVIVPSAFKYGCIAWGLTKAAQVLIAWTGHDTEASVKLNILVNLLGHHASGYLAPWLVVFATWLLYRRERRLKEQALVRLGAVNRKYESLTDPARTSSYLPASGNTNPSDLP